MARRLSKKDVLRKIDQLERDIAVPAHLAVLDHDAERIVKFQAVDASIGEAIRALAAGDVARANAVIEAARSWR